MKQKMNSLAGFLLAALVLVLAYALGVRGTGEWLAVLTAASAVFGTVTVNFQYPVQGTVAPTVSQMKPLSLVTAAVNFGADSDTIALITHNMQLATVFLPNNTNPINGTSCLFPLVSWYYVSGGSVANTFLQGSIVSSSVFQITKASGSSSAGTVNVFVLRPFTGIG